jgi:dTDP-4-amino-4,6-dideoxygalactose transaminase
MGKIMKIAEQHQLYVVEDNAQAHGAAFNGKLTGSFGHINATSFYPTKNLGALGEAGAVTTDDKNLAEKVKVLRNYGSQKRYYNEVAGFNNRIDEFEASYLNIALTHLEQWTQERQAIAAWYTEMLRPLNKYVQPIQLAKSASSVYHLYVIRTERRDELRDYLASNGVGTQIHYPIPPHLQEAYQHLGYKKGDFPVAEELAGTIVSLPIWPGLTEEEVAYVCELVKVFYADEKA